jgi:chlorobactene glucosyltransferase
MSSYLTHGLILGFIYFQAVVLMIVVSNLVLLRRPRRFFEPVSIPLVSVLVPARDEEATIAKCVQSLMGQDYPRFEVIVLDDQSSDATPTILQKLAATHPSIKVITGSEPPHGFVGKNWACHQLALSAAGDLLLFTDADTVFQPTALRHIVAAQQGEQADLITGYPRQVVGSWGERLLVPFFLWAVLCFIPLWLAYRLRLSALSSAVGQMMLFQRDAYQAIGGHAALGDQVVEDMALAKRIKQASRRWRVMKLTDLVSCRMYQGSRQAFDGFSKNLFAIFDYRLVIFLFVYLWLGLLFLEPLLVLCAKAFSFAPAASYVELAVCIGLSLLIWLCTYVELGFPPYLGLIYPLTMLANEVAAIRSLVLSFRGRLSWKGRLLARPKWKWL